MQFIIIASFPRSVKHFFAFFQKTAYIFAESRKIPARSSLFFVFFENFNIRQLTFNITGVTRFNFYLFIYVGRNVIQFGKNSYNCFT